jgi:hypothetical protein
VPHFDNVVDSDKMAGFGLLPGIVEISPRQILGNILVDQASYSSKVTASCSTKRQHVDDADLEEPRIERVLE